MTVHTLLRRQVKRFFGAESEVPKEIEAFVRAVDEAYGQFDEDRRMLEHSIELSSSDLLQANAEIRASESLMKATL